MNIRMTRNKEKSKLWYEKNKDEINKKRRIAHYKNKDKLCAQQKCHLSKPGMKEHYKKYQHNYYLENRKKCREGQRKYRERTKEKDKKQKKERYYNDVEYRLLILLRTRLGMALLSKKKFRKTQELLGCQLNILKKHLEEQFQDGMNWNNHSKTGWHIDHIIPCASFDLTKEEEQKKCFHYTNLQPLWAHENLIKGAKTIEMNEAK